MNRSAIALVVVATAASACSYDLSRLMGTHDAGLDLVVAVDAFDAGNDDVTNVDALVDMGTDVIDTPPVMDVQDVAHDIPRDVPMFDALVCPGHLVLDATQAGDTVGPSVVITGTTAGESSVLFPPTSTGCPADYSANTTPEKVYRYVVQHGPQVYATTDAPECAGVFDSTVYFRTTCDPSTGTVPACNDDDNVLVDCPSASGAPGLASGVSYAGFSAGDVIFIVVDGFNHRMGNFRLTITENAVLNAAPPPVSADAASGSNRCSCPDADVTTRVTLPFPASGDMMTSLAHAGDTLTGMRTLALSRVGGIGLQFQIMLNRLGIGAPGCLGNVATFDLLIDGTVVHSFVMDANTPAGLPLNAAFQLFGTQALAAGGSTQIGIRMRSQTVLGCGAVQFDLAHAGVLTLLGAP